MKTQKSTINPPLRTFKRKRNCKYIFCLEEFILKHGNQIYCCQKHREEQIYFRRKKYNLNKHIRNKTNWLKIIHERLDLLNRISF